MISVSNTQATIHLRNRHFSYVMHLVDGRFLAHLYWGHPIARIDPSSILRIFSAPQLADIPVSSGGRLSLDLLPQEYPAWGTGELREGVYRVVSADGTEASRLEFVEQEGVPGAVEPECMGLLRSDHDLGSAETLRIRLADPRGDLFVDLFYVLAEESPVLLRWARFTNTGREALTLFDPASAAVDLASAPYHAVTLSGAWGRERYVRRGELQPGTFSVDSRNGASSHQTSPFMALCDPESTEEHGRVFGMALGYSGNFQARCRVDQYGAPRISMGINRLRRRLEPGEQHDTPEAVLAFSDHGFNGMSHAFHEFLRRGVVARRWRREPRKIVLNTWEAMYFNVTAEKVVALAREGRGIGAELLVLDDGWFSDRRDDTSSLGDWWPNRERFPEGLGAVAAAVRAEGLEFGIWMEPEMVSPESELYRRRPEWALQINGRETTQSRNQLILDLSNPEVEEYLFATVSQVLRESTARYMKWDMNRSMTEMGSRALPPERQGEVMHRYILGLYSLLSRLTRAFPDVLFEGCAGGGGRFDMGLARFSPRFWTSDQTDAVERLEIQYGTSLVFPPEMSGSHISTVPNHQGGRVTWPWTRVHAALPFSFGFELDPRKESEEDRAIFAEGARRFMEFRERFAAARFRRLRGALDGRGSGARVVNGGDVAWMLDVDAGAEIFVFYFRPLTRSNYDPGWLRLTGLEAGAEYEDVADGRRYDAHQLMNQGLMIPLGYGDYQSWFRHLRRTPPAR